MVDEIKFPNLIGTVKAVPLSHYEAILARYVEVVSQLKQVVSIIQIGSFTTPGLSDIDLILVLDVNLPFPKWEEISIKSICGRMPGNEVIAHDVFVITEFMAQKAEAYFYIDNQNVLYGSRVGGVLNPIRIKGLKSLLAFDYAIFSLETISVILLSENVSLRRLALLISTMKHSLNLSFSLGIIEKEYKLKLIKEIKDFRNTVVADCVDVRDAHNLICEYVNLLGASISVLNKKNHVLNVWKKNYILKNGGTVFVEKFEDKSYSTCFFKSIGKQQQTTAKKYFKFIVVPNGVINHIMNYFYQDAEFLKTSYPHLDGKNMMNTSVGELNLFRKDRKEVAIAHWQFLKDSGYHKASGVAYLGLSKPRNSFKHSLRLNFLKIYHLAAAKGILN
jgi:hypothetical protein